MPSVPALSSSRAFATIWMPSIFSDHMVLQKAARVPIWGTAAPTGTVVVRLGAHFGEGKVGEDGRWIVFLDLSDAAPGPFEMFVEADYLITVSDVVVGEVWLASGQSNMQVALKDTAAAAEEPACPGDPFFREFHVPPGDASTPLVDCEGRWTVASKESVGDFSGVGYHFASALRQELKVPVGMIHASRGSTPCEAWVSRSAVDTVPNLKRGANKVTQALEQFPARWKAHVRAFSEWIEASGRSDRMEISHLQFSGPNVSTSGWVPVNLPGIVSGGELPQAGAVWLRTTVRISPELDGESLALELGQRQCAHDIFFNGRLVRRVGYKDLAGDARGRNSVGIPGIWVRAGEAVLAVRLHCPVGSAQFSEDLLLGPIRLNGVWQAKAEYALPALSADQSGALPIPPPLPAPARYTAAGSLFNAMIHPVCSYAIRGAIWYQGESNVERAWQYGKIFPLLVEDWRSQWGQGNFPFYYCQLANHGEKVFKPGESRWAELREAQSLTLKVVNTGQAVLIDLGESADIHPRNKRDVGDRLARIALAKTYGRRLVCSGPTFEAMELRQGAIQISFSNVEGGLVALPLGLSYHVRRSAGETAPLVRHNPAGALEGFAICGADRDWVWAEARIEGDTIRVWSPSISSPVAVRYGWADNPTCNLANGAGLPAMPFRTDDFPAVTKDAEYGQSHDE